jgi:hypothetical protein
MSRGKVMATADGTPGYGLDNAWCKALARLSSLEEWLDPGTIRHLRAAGVDAGWRCLEVGAGHDGPGLAPATIAAAIRACQDPGFAFMSQVTMAAWGQRR